ncbi:MAG: type II toxin-antitoxin system RelE/ParE family toxin, partial [Candidatus Sulfotelmatobacter sp.]
MSGFVLHPQAYTDVEEIWEYIAADSLDAADGVREEIYQAIQSLVPFPYIGHNRPELTAQPLRFQSMRDYVIAYAPDEKPLAVIAVLHGRRNPRVIAAILRG